MKKCLEVVAGLIEDRDRVLLAQRMEADDYGLLWEFPGGKVEDKETDQQALYRELLEEIGVKVDVGRLAAVYEDESDVLKINVRLYRCTILSGTPQARECREIGWFSLKEAAALDLAPADRKACRLLARDNNPNK